MTSRNRGRPKLRDLSYHKPTREEENQLLDAAMGDHPMVAAILGATIVEHQLENSLRERFPKATDETWGTIVSDGGPLCTFDQKITMAFLLGMIDEATRDNLKIIRQIRNAFAHAKKLVDFEHELVRAELTKIKVAKFRKKRHRDIIELVGSVPQKVYVILCIIIATQLLRKSNYNWTAKRRRRHKKLSPLTRLFVEQAANLENRFLESNQQSSQPSRSGDPTPEAPLGLLSGLLPFLEASKGKT
jgi:hypothetical protein